MSLIAIAQAYYMAMQRPRGPAYVSVPSGDWTSLTTPVLPRKVSWEFGPDQDLLAELAAAIKGSSRPAFVFGSAVDSEGAYDLAVAVAERVDAPHGWLRLQAAPHFQRITASLQGSLRQFRRRFPALWNSTI